MIWHCELQKGGAAPAIVKTSVNIQRKVRSLVLNTTKLHTLLGIKVERSSRQLDT